jgi:hypothetical protein
MMKRRELLVRVGSLAVWLPASRLLVGCSASDETDGPSSLTFTSSNVDGHTHQLELEVAIIEAPPASGTQRTTSEVSGHVHTVVLTETDLAAIRANQTVTKSTSVDAEHSHSFTFRRSPSNPTGGGSDYENPDGY